MDVENPYFIGVLFLCFCKENENNSCICDQAVLYFIQGKIHKILGGRYNENEKGSFNRLKHLPLLWMQEDRRKYPERICSHKIFLV